MLLDGTIARPLDLEKIGKIDNLKDQYGKTYQFIRRISNPIKIFHHNSVVLKIYHMPRETEPIPQNLIDDLDSFLMHEIDKGKINATQSIGFSILSCGFLSVNLWKRGNVLFTQTYTIEAKYNALRREPLEKTGVACTWEAKIIYYECELWHKYLLSTMSNADKLKYLNNFICGPL